MRKSNAALRLEPSLLDEACRAAASEGLTLNQLIIVALAEKLSALRARRYPVERAARADVARAKRILKRAGVGNRPRKGDAMPKDGKRSRGAKPPAR